jgi:hypothetical protein
MTGKQNNEALLDFVRGADVWSKWDAARRLMAARQMQAVSGSPEFLQAFHQLQNDCVATRGSAQLLAIALVVRISELVKGELRASTASLLSKALTTPLDPIWIISESRNLPREAKPAEIRENVALALSYATGPWVLNYVVDALAREDKSARCRLELCRQLAIREPHISRWIELLNEQSWSDFLKDNTTERAGRLRDLNIALSKIIRDRRKTIVTNVSVGPALATFMQKLIPGNSRLNRSTKLVEAGVSVLNLLDEILVTDFTLIPDADTYAPLAVLFRWWQPSSYPDKVTQALTEIVHKLISAIRLRARMGQRSETLSLRLRQALGSQAAAAEALAEVAQTERGLDATIDDWLRGNVRESSATSAAVGSLLAGSAGVEIIKSVAPLLLDCAEAMSIANHTNDPKAATELRRICSRVNSLASELNLVVAGRVSDLVEFNRTAHRTLDGSIPSEPTVRVIRPMVVRRRADGSQDIVERAIVKS